MEQKQLHYLLPLSKHYPGRLNLYNKTKVFKLIKSNLSNANWSRLCDGCFGPVVKLGDSLNVHSQLIHFVLMHELKTQYKHEMWFRIGGNVCRFALSDFAAVTGLNCDSYKPIDFPPVDMMKEIGGNRCSYSDLVREFVRIKDEEKKFMIANLLIIEGILLPQRTNVDINPNYLALLSNYEEFNAYPWGRICYDYLIQSLKKLNQSERDYSKFDDPEYRYGYNVFGYPIAFMIWILESFPTFRSVCGFACRDPKEAPYILRWSSISTKHVRHAKLDELKVKKLECVYPSYSDFQAFNDYGYPDEVIDPVFDDLIGRIIEKQRRIGETVGKKVEKAESDSSTEDYLADFVLAPRSLVFKKGDLPLSVKVNQKKIEPAKAKVGGKRKFPRDLVNVSQGNVKALKSVHVDKGKKSVDVDKWKAKQPNETVKRGKRLQLSHTSKVEPEYRYKKPKVSQNVNNVPVIFEKHKRQDSENALAIVVKNDGLPLADMEEEHIESLNDDVNNVDIEVAKILFSVKDTDKFVDGNVNDKEKAQDKEMEEPEWAKDLKESMSSMHRVMKDVQLRLNQIEMQVVHVRNEVGFIQKRMNARDSVSDVEMPSLNAEDDLDVIVEQLDNSVAAQVNADDSVQETKEETHKETKDDISEEVKVDEYLIATKEETKKDMKEDSVEETKDDSVEETRANSVEEKEDDSVQKTKGGFVQETKGKSVEEAEEAKDKSVEETRDDTVEEANGYSVVETRDPVQETKGDFGDLSSEMLAHLRAELDFELCDILQDIKDNCSQPSEHSHE